MLMEVGNKADYIFSPNNAMGPYQTAIGTHCRKGSISIAGMQSAELEIKSDRQTPTRNQTEARYP